MQLIMQSAILHRYFLRMQLLSSQIPMNPILHVEVRHIPVNFIVTVRRS
jgi:hypothetical protein